LKGVDGLASSLGHRDSRACAGCTIEAVPQIAEVDSSLGYQRCWIHIRNQEPVAGNGHGVGPGRINAVTVNEVPDGRELLEIDCIDRLSDQSAPNLVVGGQAVNFLTEFRKFLVTIDKAVAADLDGHLVCDTLVGAMMIAEVAGELLLKQGDLPAPGAPC
jgi:hypothetical protein